MAWMRQQLSAAAHTPAGLKYLRKTLPMLMDLHEAGCARDRAGNRTLHYDQLIALLLVQLFDPALKSMRAVCRSTELAHVRRKIGSVPVARSSMSDAARVFDAELLLPLIEDLAGRLGKAPNDPRLAGDAWTRRKLTFVDGTLLKALPRMTEAMWLRTSDGTPHHAFRLHTQFEFDKHVPVRMTLSDACNSGKSDEKHVLRKSLESDRCYVMDRWFAQFTLFNEIHACHGSYVCRIREPGERELIEPRIVSPEAQAAGVVGDEVVRLGVSMKTTRRQDHPCRLIVLKVTPHAKRGGQKGKRSGPPNTGLLYLATDLPDVPAEIIALIYQQRYAIELFFRFFKHVLGCRHLLFHCPNGIAMQAYCAMIACMLLSLWTGGTKATIETMEMFRWHFSGMATDAELNTYLRGLKKPRD